MQNLVFRIPILILLAASFAGCSLTPRDPEGVNLEVNFGSSYDMTSVLPIGLGGTPGIFAASGLPTSASGFDCVAVNVTGPGIPPIEPDHPDSGGGTGADHCTYAGATSDLASMDSSISLEVDVPTGPDRVVQVVGIMTTDGSCPPGNIANIIAEDSGEDVFTEAAELGKAFIPALFSSQAVSVANSYSTSKSFGACGGSGSVQVLPVEGFAGDAGASSWGDTPSYSSTALPSGLSEMTQPQIDSFGQDNNTMLVTRTGTSQVAAVLLAYSLEGSGAASYSVDVVARGGRAPSGSCTAANIDDGNSNIEARLWENAGWGDAYSHIGTATFVGFSVLSTNAISNYKVSTVNSSTSWGAVASKNDIAFVAIRSSQAADGTHCSILEIESVRFYED